MHSLIQSLTAHSTSILVLEGVIEYLEGVVKVVVDDVAVVLPDGDEEPPEDVVVPTEDHVLPKQLLEHMDQAGDLKTQAKETQTMIDEMTITPNITTST